MRGERHWPLILAVTVLTIPLLCSTVLADAGADLVAQALKAYKNGSAQESMEYLNKVLKKDPYNYQALLGIGTNQFLKHRYDEALKTFQKLVYAYPDSVRARLFEAYALAALGRTQKAMDAFQRILMDKPKSPPALIGLGYTEYLAGDRFSAAADMKKALDLQPNNKWLGNIIAELQRSNQEYLQDEEARKQAQIRSDFENALAEASAAQIQAPAEAQPRAELTPKEKWAFLNLMVPEIPDLRRRNPLIRPTPGSGIGYQE